MATPKPKVVRAAVLRTMLGVLQMMGAALSLILVLSTGLSQASLVAIVATGLMTTTSLCLFRCGATQRG